MFSKLLAYHTGVHTEVYFWRGGVLFAGQRFDADAEGFAGFVAYLGKQAGRVPLYFLVDIAEEDFRLDTIPHVPGRSRAALIERKLGQLFRNETHRYAAIQGRMEEGRRDDRLLLCALTSEPSLRPWIDAALACGTPLAGIFSAPLLSQEIILKLGLDAIPHLLLLTRLNDSGLRQSYFQDGRLKFSRLVSVGDGTDALIRAINEESDKARQYLSNQRLLPRDSCLEIHLLCRDDECGELVDGCADAPLRRFVLHPLRDVAATLKLRHHSSADVATLFLQFLARHDVKNHYANTGETRRWRLKRVAFAMKSSGIALLAIGAVSAAYTIADGQNFAMQADQISLRAERLEAQTLAMRKALPALPAEPDVLKGSVELAKRLAAYPRTPETLMTPIGRALATLPQIRLMHFKWIQTANPGLDINAKAGLPEGIAPNAGNEVLEMALLEGEVDPFIDYRDALAAVEQLIAKLESVPGLQVAPVMLPIEVGPQSRLKGQLGEDAPPRAANFALKLVYRAPGS